MRAVLQRVSRAKVTVDGEITGEIGRGILVLLGVGINDSEAEVRYLVEKIVNLRIFSDADDKMNLSVQDVGGGLLDPERQIVAVGRRRPEQLQNDQIERPLEQGGGRRWHGR